MIEAHGIPYVLERPIVGRLSARPDPLLEEFPLISLVQDARDVGIHKDSIAFVTNLSREEWDKSGGSTCKPGVFSVDNAGVFHHADGVALLPSGKTLLVYRPGSNSNVLFVTSECNSNCLMCSQPPEKGNGSDLADLAFAALPIMDPETDLLCITGGEPTLLGEMLLRLVDTINKRFPLLDLHILSNGRYFAETERAESLAKVGHPRLLIGIPLFSDNPYDHDSITQVRGSFSQTVKGIINLARFGIAVEIRIVMVRLTVTRLERLAQFIWANFPFVSQVCFMGVEPTGRAEQHLSEIWQDPAEYQSALERAVEYLCLRGIHTNIYNEQLCVLNRRLWKYARKAISDWKNTYIEECTGCTVMDRCGGFFASAVSGAHSRAIRRV